LTFNEQIVEAAKSIGKATTTLVKAATAAHRELVAQGKLKVYEVGSDDSQWSEGLVSAVSFCKHWWSALTGILPQAKLVAAATSSLCEAANLVVTGSASEDKLIAGAKAVASSTAQLLMACQVKAETRSENNQRLQVCISPYRNLVKFVVI